MSLDTPGTWDTAAYLREAKERRQRLSQRAPGAKPPRWKPTIVSRPRLTASERATLHKAAAIEARISKIRDWMLVASDGVNWRPHIVTEVQQVVSEFYGVSVREMTSPRRAAHLVKARQIAMYLAKEFSSHSFPEIGRRFGGRDHTTVLYAVDKTARLRAEDPDLDADISKLIVLLGFQEG